MGHMNVDRLLNAQPPLMQVLTPVQFICLLHMAKLAHDQAPLYWGGVDFLALSMSYPPGPSGRRIILRHIRALEDSGFIVRTHKKQGRRVVYELQLPPLLPPSRRPHQDSL